MARSSGESVARKELPLPSRSLQKLRVVNNHVNLKADPSLVKPNDETTAQADTLLTETLKQRIS